MKRQVLLNEILEAGPDMDIAISQMREFEWDSDEELVTLSRRRFTSVLNRFASGEMTSEAFDTWVNFIECRDDIDYSEVSEEIYQLANCKIQDKSVEILANEIVNRAKAT